MYDCSLGRHDWDIGMDRCIACGQTWDAVKAKESKTYTKQQEQILCDCGAKFVPWMSGFHSRWCKAAK